MTISYSLTPQSTGSLGKPVLDALIASGKFNITVVARNTSTAEVPSKDNVRQVKVDFSSHQALVDAFRGNDAIVLTLGDFQNLGKNTQVLSDAAIDAGIKRIILSEFGGCVFSSLYSVLCGVVTDIQRFSDLYNAPGKDLPIFKVKVDARAYVEGKAKEGKITWTTIAVGGFFDWGLVNDLLGFGMFTLSIKCDTELTVV